MTSTRPYQIVPKRDFGGRPFLINGERVISGFVVTDGFVNVMPAATWFRTVADAMRAIAVWEQVKYDSRAFWEVYRAA